MLQALLWDVDGTLAETERDGHRVAFNRAFETLGLPWRWDEARYGELLRVTGGRERLLADMAIRADAPVLADERDALARELHRLKNGFYAELVRGGGIALRPGVRELIEAAAARGLRQGIVTTTSRVNVEALLARHLGARWADRFAGVVSGEDVAAKKPSAEGYRRALDALRLAPLAALAIEDSCSGAAAARGADVPVVVVRSAYFADDVVDQAVAIGPGFETREGWQPAPSSADDTAITLDDLIDWHARMEWVGAPA
jgi:HAD superfamily hydrolase (TIGR01509 family)